MNTLLLLRHAKSSWDDPLLEDFDRPLARRGREAAPAMGRLMAERGWLPDLALVSPAARARETWALLAAALPAPVEPRLEPSLYMAAPEEILALLRALDTTPETVLVIGHNPGLEECAALLAAPGSDPRALARMRRKFPTAALARFAFEGPWSALGSRGARLLDFLKPKDL
ncbi:SixA phosphatase family protein [Oricola thermophila]|uniref:Histidine phosphatase family protein n=1 Tax=Oricola thermophila TaxID=2742145 RepID=A0A6N1V9E1_9HYPH|nr:histidine phosphatase family protein [Oricola thermophila]QKV17133.1 histidine phosphatase family protein [Oricola thermophila]